MRVVPYLRLNSTKNWVDVLPTITESINKSPCVSIGYLSPADVKSVLDEPMVREAQLKLAAKMTEKQQNRYFPRQHSYAEMVEASLAPSLRFHKGDFVYLDKIQKSFSKGTDEKRGEIFLIDSVLKVLPVRYKLLNLNFNVKGDYYSQNLKMVPKEAWPTSMKTDYFK